MANNPSIVRVSAVRIRQIFNSSQHASAIDKGEYTEIITSDRVLLPATARRKRLPRGTRSQYIRYFSSTGEWLVGMHRYLLPSGKIGASGKADPKRVVMGDVIYLFHPRAR